MLAPSSCRADSTFVPVKYPPESSIPIFEAPSFVAVEAREFMLSIIPPPVNVGSKPVAVFVNWIGVTSCKSSKIISSDDEIVISLPAPFELIDTVVPLIDEASPPSPIFVIPLRFVVPVTVNEPFEVIELASRLPARSTFQKFESIIKSPVPVFIWKSWFEVVRILSAS